LQIDPIYNKNTVKLLFHPQDTIARNEFYRNGDEYVSKSLHIDLSAYASPYNGDTTYFTLYVNGNAVNNTTGIFEIDAADVDKDCYMALSSPARYPGLILYTPHFRASYPYDTNDVNRIKTFLDLYSKFGTPANGRTNGYELAALDGGNGNRYVSGDPRTFPGVSWVMAGGKMRARYINWSECETIKGDLDLTGCNQLLELSTYCATNKERNAVSALVLNGCIRLEDVFCGYNQIAELSLNGCVALKVLDVSHNVIKNDVEIPNAQALESIILSDNQISNIIVDSLPSLEGLYLDSNKLSILDLRGNVKLTGLYCSDNAITGIDLTNNNEIVYLYANNNNLGTITVTNMPKLRELYVNNNSIEQLDLSQNPELVALGAANNKLSELDMLANKYVTELTANNNALNFVTINYEKIPNELILHPQAKIVFAELDSNYVLTSDTVNLSIYAERNDSRTYYELYYADGTPVSPTLYNIEDGGIVSNFSPELKDHSVYIAITNNRYPGLTLQTIMFNTVPPSNYNKIDSMRLRTFLDTYTKDMTQTNGMLLTANATLPYNPESPATYPVLWRAIGNEYRLVKIDWTGYKNLDGDAEFSGCDALDTLIIIGTDNEANSISSLSLLGCNSLEYIKVNSTNVENVSLTTLAELTYVDLSSNTIKNFVINKCDAVTYLNVYNNRLRSLDVLGLPTLETLNCSKNYLVFKTLYIEVAPKALSWSPQNNVVPASLISSNDSLFYAKRFIDFNLDSTYNNGEVIYRLVTTSNGQEVFVASSTDTTDLIPNSLHKQELYCKLICVGGVLDGEELLTVPFIWDTTKISSIEEAPATFALYPNPAVNVSVLNLNGLYNAGNISVSLYNMSGTLVGEAYNGEYQNEIAIETSRYATGSYYVIVATGNKHYVLPLTIVR
jgi:hypothetical protein